MEGKHRRRKPHLKTTQSWTPNKDGISDKKPSSKHANNSNGTKGKNNSSTNTQNKHKQTGAKEDECPSIFPKQTIWIIWTISVMIKMTILCRKDSGWILHPDEVFQSTEVAHSLVYGYGFRPYEYLPPPNPNATSVVEKQQAATGMYSLRSFIYPQILAGFLWIMETCGIHGNPFYMCRIFHGFVSSHLSISVFIFLKQLLGPFSSNDKSLKFDVVILCSVLIAFSKPLTVFGTHSLVNSFLSPFVFLGLATLTKLINCYKHDDKYRVETNLNECDTLREKLLSDVSHGFYNNNNKHGDGTCPAADNGLNSQLEMNRNNHNNSEELNHFDFESPTQLEYNKDFSHSSRIQYNATHKYQNTTLSTNKSTAFTGSTSTLRTNVPAEHTKAFCTGVLFGVVSYIRLDLFMFIGTMGILILTVKCTRRMMMKILPCLLVVSIGGCVGLVVGGLQDKMFYGTWFLSPYQWFIFNVKNGMSGTLFGKQDILFYVKELFFRDVLSIICLSVVCFVAIFGRFLFQRLYVNNESRLSLSFTFNLMGICLVILLCIYSLQPHKELRFVHNIIVLYNIMLGIALYVCVSIIKHSIVRKLVIYCVLVSWIFNLYITYPVPDNKGNTQWAYVEHWDTHDVNKCLQYVGQQKDATGLFLDRSIHITGGYSVLHKHIPIFTLIHHEFQEFSHSSSEKTSHTAWYTKQPISVAMLNRISNFVAVENKALLMKYLIQQKEYNYLVVKANRNVMNIGFEKVYLSGTMQVLRRAYDTVDEVTLQGIAEYIPLGVNATVLEYEGSWLHTFGLYEKAIERLEYGLRLGKPRIRTFQLLSLAHSGLGLVHKAQEYYEQCTKLYGQACSYPQPKVILHTEYKLDLNLTL